MTTQEEQRVIEALQALTGGLTVTEQETLESHGRLQSRLEPYSPRRRLIALSAAAAAVVVAVGLIAFVVVDRDDKSSPAPATPPDTPAKALARSLQSDAYALSDVNFLAGQAPTRETLAGLWLLRAFYDPVALVVDGDGDWSQGAVVHPATGPSTLAGDIWTRRVAGSPDCGDNGLLPWQGALAADGSLRLEYAGTVNSCTPADNREVWDRVGPGSPIGQYLVAIAADVDWQAPVDWSWEGMYVAPETGFVLDIHADGNYSFYKDLTAREPVAADQGKQDLALEPGTISATCSGGRFAGTFEVGKTPEVADYVFALPVARITPTENGCASGVADQIVWVKLGL